MSTSATGGYLVVADTSSALNDLAFARMLQGVVAALTGIPGNLVRPRWQVQPPTTPPFSTNWCAVGKERVRSVGTAYVCEALDGLSANSNRWQLVDVLASFRGPDREMFSDLLIAGFTINQNREGLIAAGFNLQWCADAEMGADLLGEQWVTTSEVRFTLARWLTFDYTVLNIVGANLIIHTDVQDNGLPDMEVDFSV